MLLSPGQVIAEAREAFCQGKIGISVCYELSLHPLEQQKPLLDLKLTGVSRDDMVRQGRKQRSGAGSAAGPKSRKLKIAMPSGVTITLAGVELSLEDAIRELTDALAEIRKAEKQNLDIKTFQAAARDRAKAGA